MNRKWSLFIVCLNISGPFSVAEKVMNVGYGSFVVVLSFRAYLTEQSGECFATKFSEAGSEIEQEGQVMSRIEPALPLHPELALYSPYIVGGKGNGTWKGRYFIFMDFANGGVCLAPSFLLFTLFGLFWIQSLKGLVDEGSKPVPIRIAAKIIRQLRMGFIF